MLINIWKSTTGHKQQQKRNGGGKLFCKFVYFTGEQLDKVETIFMEIYKSPQFSMIPKIERKIAMLKLHHRIGNKFSSNYMGLLGVHIITFDRSGK